MKKGVGVILLVTMLSTTMMTSGCVTRKNIAKTVVVGLGSLAGAFFNKVIRVDKRFRKHKKATTAEDIGINCNDSPDSSFNDIADDMNKEISNFMDLDGEV